MTQFSGTIAIRAIKNNDYQAVVYPGTYAGLVSALAYCAAPSITSPGGTVLLGSGVLLITAPLSIGSNVVLRGQGRYTTMIKADPTFSGAQMVTNSDQAGGMQWCSIEKMTIDGNSSGGATVPIGIYFKGIGQPGYIRDISVNGCTGIGIKVEGISTNAGDFLIENAGASNCPLGSFVVTGYTGGYLLRGINAEFVNAGVAAILIDGPTVSFYPAAITLDGVHIEGLLAGSIGIHIKSSRNVHIRDVIYFGSGSTGDLVKITGTQAEVQGFIIENLTASANSVVNSIVDSTNNYTLANTASGVNVTRYDSGLVKHSGTIVFRRGTDQAAGTTVTANAGNIIHLTGTTTVDNIVTDTTEMGKVVVLWLGGNIKIRDNSNSGGNLFLNDSNDYNAVTDSSITLFSTGSNWIEMARSASTGAFSFSTLPDNATPSVYGCSQWKCNPAGPTTITNFTNGVRGQEIVIIFENNNATLSDAGTLKLNGGFVSTADDTMRLVFDGTNWFELSRSVN